MTPLEILNTHFGHDTFRPGQRAIIEAHLAGRDVQVLLPTGGGKSVCFQVPAVWRARRGEGPTLVVSPLIALMEDQLATLRRHEIAAEVVHSGMRWGEQRKALDQARTSALLYVSPERARSSRFGAWLRDNPVAALVIDEAHCISEWGHDYRPDYLHLGELRDRVRGPVMALTATATPRVMGEIARCLRLRDPAVIRGSFVRPNLRFSVEHHEGDKVRVDRLIGLLDQLGLGRDPARGRVVVYAATRKRVRSVCDALRAEGFAAGFYHAGRTDSARANARVGFEEGRHAVLAATTAFGMGIDQPDVRLVAHIQAPGTLESYVQQAGRAGRDGRPAHCVLLYGASDALTQARIRGESPAPGVEAGWTALMDYVYGTTCREQHIVGHFGAGTPPPCGRCDVCTRPELVADEVHAARTRIQERRTDRARKRARDRAVDLDASQLDLIVAFVDALKKPVGKGLVAAGLRGSQAKRAKKAGMHLNPHHGALKGVPELAIIAAVQQLLDDGRLVPKGRKYPTVWVPDKRVRSAPRPRAAKTPASGLAGQLKNLRRREARRRRWKPYQVFSNATLEAIVETRPASAGDLLAIPGMGPKRLERFGDQILHLVATAEE